jgi:predicted nucleotidyltransferase
MLVNTFEELKRAIDAVRSDIEANYPIRLVGVFGSLAREEAGPDSDVDILVEAGPGLTLSRLGAATLTLEKALGRPVDLVFESSPHPRSRLRVVAELRPL